MVQTVRDTSQRVDGTDHAHGADVQDMRVDHGGLDVGVAEKFLHRADVLAGFLDERAVFPLVVTAAYRVSLLCIVGAMQFSDRLGRWSGGRL